MFVGMKGKEQVIYILSL